MCSPAASLGELCLTASRGPYEYTQLPSQSFFRLVELLPGKQGDDISYNLHLGEVGVSRPYEAISYAWGDPNIKVASICDGRTLQITPNLCAVLRALRLRHEVRWLWADAICIDQENFDERSSQVKRMLDIYRNSTGVIVWLGPDEHDEAGQSMAQKARDLIDETTLKLVQINVDKVWTDTAAFSPREVLEFTKIMPLARDQRIELVLQNLHKFDDLSPLIQQNEWALHDNPRNLALVRFFSRPWFQRLWVIQEVNSTTNVTVMCGPIEISWDRIGLAAAFIGTIGFALEKVELQFRDSFFHNADIMRHRKALQSWSIYQLMSYTSEFHASDPKDHIYGKLGLPAFALSGMRVEPDYNKSVKEVYSEFAISGLNHHQNLDILSFAGHRNGIREDIPSWVPQWDKNLIATCILLRGSNIFASCTWKASADTIMEMPLRIRDDSLLVKGVVLDRICHSIEIDRAEWRREYPSSKHNPIYRMWQQEEVVYRHESKSQPRVYSWTGESLFQAYAISIVAGIDFQGRRISENRDEFQAKISRFIDFCASGRNGLECRSPMEEYTAWFEYRWTADTFTSERVIFETFSGHVGLGPKSLQKDDLVCVLYGGNVPYILRPRNEHYTLLGESYVHGFMDGEAISMLQDGRLKEQVFEIC